MAWSVKLPEVSTIHFNSELYALNSISNKMSFDSSIFSNESYHFGQNESSETDFTLGTNSSGGESHGLGIGDNGAGNTVPDVFKHSLEWTIILIFAYALVFIVGAIGNLMVVCVIVLRPQMKTVTNMFILNLAVADLLVNFFCVIPTLLVNIISPWVLGSFMCKAVTFVQGVSVCASVYSLVAISLDRFLAIWFPTTMPRGLKTIQARIIILCIWIVSLSIYTPWLFVFTLTEKDGQVYCVEDWSSSTHSMLYFIFVNLILCYGLPLMLIMVLNVLIWLHVAKRKVPQESATLAAIKRVHRKTRHGVLRMLTVITLTFLISWLPFYTIFFIMKIGAQLPTSLETIIPFAQWLGSSNSSCNPILYAFLNKKFRDAFTSLIACPKSIPRRRNKNAQKPHQNLTATAAGDIPSLNNSTLSINNINQPSPPSFSFRPRATFRYPIVRV